MPILPNSTYRDVIQRMISINSSQRGYKSKLAQAAGCQSSYLSRVIRGSVHLTLDQASAMADFWGFSDAEAESFLTLLNLERAGTKGLRERLDRKLLQIRANQADVKDVKISGVSLKLEQAMRYYSDWYWSATHVALTLPHLRTSAALAKRFCLPKPLVEEVLRGLEAMKLIKKSGKEWECIVENFSLVQHRELLSYHHARFRQQANFSLSARRSTGTHHTSVIAMSPAEFNELKAGIKKIISGGRRISHPKQGNVYGLCLDLFLI